MFLVVVFIFVFFIVVGYVIKVMMGLRVLEEEEMKGLDIGEYDMMVYVDFVESVVFNLFMK